MAPTRELAIQIQEESDKFGKEAVFKTLCCYGVAPKGPQAQQLSAGVHGVIGTPGRINDFLEGGQLQVGKVCKLVLDEADRMLDMGFEPQIRKIMLGIPPGRQTLFFTATWPNSVRKLAAEFLRGAWTVTVGNRDELKGNQDITQIIHTVGGRDKQNAVVDILRQGGVMDKGNMAAKALVFCSTKKMCDNMAQQLERKGLPCAAIHGDKNQRDREWALNGLKAGDLKALVATDVAARGLDIKGVSLVVNFDPPGNIEDYVHRIGRTGRAGKKGHAVALICERDTHALKGIITVMKRTNQVVTPELEELSRNAPPPPPSGRAMRGGGPPPVTIDPNFKAGIQTGSLSAPEREEGGPPAPTNGNGADTGGPPQDDFNAGGGGGRDDYKGGGKGKDYDDKGKGKDKGKDKGGKGKGKDRDDRGGYGGGGGRDDRYGGGRDDRNGGREDRGRRSRSPPRRRRSPSRRRRSPSNRRRKQSSSSNSSDRNRKKNNSRRSPSVQRKARKSPSVQRKSPSAGADQSKRSPSAEQKPRKSPSAERKQRRSPSVQASKKSPSPQRKERSRRSPSRKRRRSPSARPEKKRAKRRARSSSSSDGR